jgi:hypothetical protein
MKYETNMSKCQAWIIHMCVSLYCLIFMFEIDQRLKSHKKSYENNIVIK